MNSLYLVDADSNLTRTYKKSLDNVDEENLKDKDLYMGLPFFFVENAVANVFNGIKKLNTALGSPFDYIAISLDPYSRCKHRTQIDENYKSNRPSKTAGFLLQKSIFSDYMSTVVGFTVVDAGDYESDDVFATFVRKIGMLNMPIYTYIMSKDKDLYQLLSPTTFLFDGEYVINVESCLNKFSLPPEKIRDYLAMTGDVADGVLGIKGCGDATAKKLLAHNTLHDLIENPEIIANSKLRARNAVIAGLQDLEHIQRQIDLVSLVDDVELNIPSFRQLARKKREQSTLSVRDFVGINRERYASLYNELLNKEKSRV